MSDLEKYVNQAVYLATANINTFMCLVNYLIKISDNLILV